jgi:ferredoxin
MKIEITNRCTGHGRCWAIGPNLVDADDDGFGQVRNDGFVAESSIDEAYTVERSCPEGAVKITDAPAS